MEDFFYKYLSLYNKLPLSVKQLIGRIYSILPKRLKYGSYYDKYLKRIRKFQKMDNVNIIDKEQNDILIAHVNKSIELIPYYHNYNEIKNLSNFRKLPVINKNTIIENHSAFINPLLKNKKIAANTGGSSGTPMEFFIEKGVSRSKEKAHFDWYWSQFGYYNYARVLMIRGLPIPGNKLYEFRSIDNILNVSCYGINESNITIILDQINKFKPRFIHAYPSSLKVITTLLETHKKDIKFSIEAIFAGSEYLNMEDRNYFKDFYKAKVANWYGHSERLVHGGNCPFSDEYHFYPSYGFFELLDDNNNVIEKPDIEGRIIATGFDNMVMPFIRYDTGDLGVLSSSKACKCGFKGISLKYISGRGQDFIVLTDSTKVSLTAFIFGQHLEAFKKIRELQVVQQKKGEIELRIVKSPDFNVHEEESIKRTLLNSVNNKIIVNFNYVTNIPKTSRGKNIFFISKINNN